MQLTSNVEGRLEYSGTVGAKGLNPVLRRVAQSAPGIRLHLIGHSFGGRLVTAAASAAPVPGLRSLTLCQAAFSHYGFAAQWEPGSDGAFRNVIAEKRVDGPVLVTESIQGLLIVVMSLMLIPFGLARLHGFGALHAASPHTPVIVVAAGGQQEITARLLGEGAASWLPAGEVRVRVEWSSLNYKDGLAITGSPGVLRTFPIVPGVSSPCSMVSTPIRRAASIPSHPMVCAATFFPRRCASSTSTAMPRPCANGIIFSRSAQMP